MDLTKVGRQMLQSQEWGTQRTEAGTGRSGGTMALDQINTYRSVVGSEMGDPVLVQQLPTMMDDTMPLSTVIQSREGFFKRPLLPVQQFRIDQLAPKPLVKPTLQQSRTPSLATSSVRVGESAAEVTHRLRDQSPSPEVDGRPRQEHKS